MSMSRVVLVAGGTGGHVFPAVALAEVLRSRGVEVLWIGTERGLERRVAERKGLSLRELPFSGVRGKGLMSLLLLPLRLVRAVGRSMGWLSAFRPDLVICFGGYVSAPVGLAARLRGCPVWLHEQNAVMGSANRLLQRIAHRVFLTYPATQGARPDAQAVGCPVRPELRGLPPVWMRPEREGPLHLLLIGGSLGAQALNRALPKALGLARERGALDPSAIRVWHQTGGNEQTAAELRQLYEQAGVADALQTLQPFVDDMPAAYAWADLILCRAGASTLAEIQAMGLPALLVPLPNAIDDHQTANARALEATGLAIRLVQDDSLVESLALQLASLNPRMLRARADQASQAMAQPAERVMADAALSLPSLKAPAGDSHAP